MEEEEGRKRTGTSKRKWVRMVTVVIIVQQVMIDGVVTDMILWK